MALPPAYNGCTCSCHSTEGITHFSACCYPEKENSMKTFETFEVVDDMSTCMKRPIEVHAMQVEEHFRVNSLEGDYKQGKPGDYLMRGIDDELYICDKEIFEKTYRWM